jgi:hypothetical protein
MAQLSTYNLPQMTDLVKRSFEAGLQAVPQEMRTSGIVVEQPMAKNTGLFKRFAERIHRNQYASERAEGDNSKTARVQYGYEKDMQVSTVALQVSITKTMRIAGKDKEILDEITSLTEVCPATIDLDLAHRLSFHTATSYTNRDGSTVATTVGDGLALASASHTLTGSATTYSNIITGNPQFSKGALEIAERSFVEETFNNLGEKMLMTPDTIVTTDDPNTINQVRELLKATADVSTSNSGTFNVYSAKYKHVKSGRIAMTAAGAVDSTKRKYWFLASSRHSDFYLCILEQPYLKTPTDGNNGEEFSSENRNYLTGATYGMAIVTGKWIRTSTGLGG